MSIWSRQTSLAAPGVQRGARAGVLVLRADRFDASALAVEAHRIRRDHGGGDRAQVLADRLERAVATAQQIEIARRPIGPVRPEPQEHRPFEHEALAAVRGAEAVEETLEAVAGEQGLVVVAGLLRAVEQARGDGGGEIGLARHAIASK
jgi:hypothetical protein